MSVEWKARRCLTPTRRIEKKAGTQKPSAETVIKDIRRVTRKQYGAEEKIRIVLEGLRGEESLAALCRREAIAESLYYNWSKEFLEAGKKRLAGDTARAATTDEVKVLRSETRDVKEVVAEQALEMRRDCQEFRARGLFPSLADKPFAECDGERRLGLEPLARGPFPFLGRVIEHQI